MNPGFQKLTLDVRTGDGRNFVSLEPLIYVTALGAVLTIPAGTASDGASTPASVWSVLPPFGVYWLAAFLHDWLYRNTKMPRVECDNLLLEAMQSLNVDAAIAQTIFNAVRLGGQDSFDADRAAQPAA